MSNKKFILTTGDVNGNNRQIKMSGVDLSRFIANPIMYYNHDRYTMPIGKWENIKIETIDNIECLTAEAIFDTKDDLGKEVARKVKEGFLNAVSIGYFVIDYSYFNIPKQNSTGQTVTNEIRLINECQIYEASIVDVPANQYALSLDTYQFADNVTPFTEKVLEKLTDSSLLQTQNSYKTMKINKNLMNVLAFFGLGNVDTDEKDNLILSDSQVDDMSKKLDDLQSKLTQTQDSLKAVQTEKDALQTANDSLQTKLNEANDKITLISGTARKDGADKQADIKDTKDGIDEDNFSFNKEADALKAKDTWGKI